MVLENENIENDKASSWLDTQDAELTMPKRGELRDGVIASIGSHEVLVDVGAKSEGAIPATELAELTAEEQAMLQVGNTIKVYVVNPEDRNGTIALSLLKARELSDWTLAEELSQSQQAYKGTIVGFNKGGLIVKIGQLRGFVPTSQISNERRKLLGPNPTTKWANPSDADIMVKVVEVDQRRNRLILSERAAAKEVRESRRESLLGQLEVGQVHTGKVISVTDFGAFVDLGGVDGLVHLSEMTWKPIEKPQEYFKVGQEVNVQIINIDKEHGRIALSTKRLEQDPFELMAAKYKPGQLVRATITRLTKFGAFARLQNDPEVEGLIHISEISSSKRIAHPKEAIAVGESYTMRIIKIEGDRRRIGLSIKEVDSPRYAEQDMEFYLSMSDEQ